MPQLTVVLGRKPVQAYDLDQPVVRIGREPGMDVVIDNPSVSRSQAELRQDGEGWTLTDLGSANGTFLNGKKISTPQPVKAGDEIGVGKFSILFGKMVAVEAPASAQPSAAGEPAGTMHMKGYEMNKLLDDYSKQRKAQINWESGGQKGTHYFTDAAAVLVGTDDLCDVRVPKGPKHHLLVIRRDGGCEIRNLALFGKMKVGGAVTKKARLKDGDVVEMAGTKLTFLGDLAS